MIVEPEKRWKRPRIEQIFDDFFESADALELAARHPTYDCEYVALAQELNIPLVTGDETVADLFPDTAVLVEEYASA